MNDTRLSDAIRTLIGVILVLAGLVVLSGWIAHIPILVEFRAGYVPMVFNTAFCFILVGATLSLPGLTGKPRPDLQLCLSLLLLGLSLATLVEILCDISLGIDWPYLHTWIGDGNLKPGRMAPNTALGFMTAALALILSERVSTVRQAIALQVLTFSLLAIGFTGLVGYMLAPDLLFGWARSARMAIQTAAGMIIASAALWIQWTNATWYRSGSLFREDGKIAVLSTAILTVVTLTAGLIGFVAMQANLETALQNRLATNFQYHIDSFRASVERAQDSLNQLARQPYLADLGQRLTVHREDIEAGHDFDHFIRDLSPLELQSVVFSDLQGNIILQSGKLINHANFSSVIHSTPKQVLLWDGRMHVQIEAKVMHGATPSGRLLVQYALESAYSRLVDTSDLGTTSEAVVCLEQNAMLSCLPQPRNPTALIIRSVSKNGKRLPMASATKGIQGVGEAQDYRGNNVIAAYGPLAPGLGFVLKQDTVEMYAGIRDQLKIVSWSLLLLLLLGAMVLRSQLKPLALRLLSSEAEASEKEKQISTLLNSVDEGIITIDEEGTIASFNPAAARIFGWPVETAIGKNITLLMPSEHKDPHTKGMHRFLREGTSQIVGHRGVELPGLRQDGSIFSLELSVNEMLVDSNRRFVGIVRDITERKKAEQAVLAEKDAALAAGRAKSDFVANMSHEIRSPMNAVLGMLQLLQQTQMNARQRDYASKAESAARSLLGLLNDILDFSKMEAGKLALDAHPFNVDKMLRDLSIILSANVGSKNLEILFRIDPALPSWIVGDALRLQQILLNLTGNAVKFTEQGEVVLTVQVMDKQTSGIRVAFAVRDTGIGISPEHREKIFEEFSQAETSTTRRFGGTGLGLAISQRLVGLMGGELRVDSTVGKGSVFEFTLEFQQAAPEFINASHPRLLQRLDCLVVDDNPSALMIISDMATSLGWKVDQADNGAAALAAVQRRGPDRPYDVLFIDWRMPLMDGWETSRRLKQLLVAEKAPLIIMVTAHDRSLLEEKQSREGQVSNGILTKPITPSMLFNAVAEAISTQPETTKEDIEPSLQRLVNVRLLLVEDNILNQQVACELLGHEGAAITMADSGQAALDKLLSAPEAFDAILMDIQMPGMDGYIATRLIRSQLGLHAPPIIAMTANVMATDRTEALAAGMVDHVGKPFDLTQLIEVILRHARRTKTTDDSTDASPGTVKIVDKTEVAGPAKSIPMMIDSEEAINRMGGRRSTYLKALNSFIGEADKIIVQLQMASKDRQSGGALATLTALHTLKSLAGLVGANQLAEMTKQTELLMRETSGSEKAWQEVEEVLVSIGITIINVEQLAKTLHSDTI